MRATATVRGLGAPGQVPQRVVRRFSWWQRATHALLAFAVFGLILTGMPLRYPDAFWASPLFVLWRSQAGAAAVHKVCAVLFFAAAGMHLVTIASGLATGKVRLRTLFGPDSILPNPKDVRDVRQHIRYLKGLGPRPEFGRFAFWEKFDYLAEIWGLLVIGLSGLIMWFPVPAARLLPGWVVNAALIFHSYEAILAMAFLFTVHFFNTHLRPEVFPVDPVIFSGDIPLREVGERYPGWYRRLDPSASRAVPGGKPSPIAHAIAGTYMVMGIGIMVLVMLTAVVEAARFLVALIRG